MPEDTKKNSDKKRNEPKEQRKPRHSRNQAGKSDRKAEKAEEIKTASKVTVPQKPVYEEPGPEFYKNLKRETEEIVKITEAENAKYRKKEIQSNWAKYEMPIASYEDVDEQDVGADYEKLIQAPISAGGHFQFKHEKSWDMSTAPSLYDKYFEINMDNLSTAISTIPFYERNDIDQSLFSETDLLSMNNRASKYKLKYFNDKAYSTSETIAQDKILKAFKENLNLKDGASIDEKASGESILEFGNKSDSYNINLDFNFTKTESAFVNSNTTKPIVVDDFDDEFLFKDVPVANDRKAEVINEKIDLTEDEIALPKSNINNTTQVIENLPKTAALPTEHPVTSKVNPIIESPEDLEKWLDDFLDS